MINLIKAREYFEKYCSNYDINHPRIKLKIIHMQHVAKNSKKIAELLELDQDNIELAELIGLLHDLGRFDQWKFYGTFSDKLSIDHGQKSVEILFGDKEIRNFIEDDEYDAIIYKAINNHSKLEIEKGLSNIENLHCKIIRDADNLDIFRGLLQDKIEDYTHFGSPDISKEILSSEFVCDFKKENVLLYSKAKTDMDIMVAIIAHIYAISFPETLKIIMENDYINCFVKKINAQDNYTREKLNEISEYAMNYIIRKINQNEKVQGKERKF